MRQTDAAQAALGVGPASLGLPPTVSVDLTALVVAELVSPAAA
ncbi:hypothetical protein GCM10022286_14010 [Gryllotalpicola daejeonensis]|uniref:Uncharacterized protein n=1 Tax=Gryllotalpicola daejeonensis TaxID=993087 RepID=A0ABP7ZIZ9_9MICO